MEERYNKLALLIKKYYEYRNAEPVNEMSEETTRVWINDMLAIFGWDVHDVSEVVQEQMVSDEQKNKLGNIDSKHSKPDYTLVNGKIVKTYLDAKKRDIDIFKNKEAAFQIRSDRTDGLQGFRVRFCQTLNS